MKTIKQVNISLQRVDYTRKAYDGIRKMMFLNEIKPREKISYRQLAEKLGMSTTPVIQALNQLELLGLVHRERNRGYFIEPITLKQMEEIYDLRQLIETSLIHKAIDNIDEKSINILHSALQKHIEATKKGSLDVRLLADQDFHLTIAKLSNCNTQYRMIEYLFDLLYLKYRGVTALLKYPKTWANEHQQIFEHMLHRDKEKTQKALAYHLENTKTHVIANLSKMIAEGCYPDLVESLPKGE